MKDAGIYVLKMGLTAVCVYGTGFLLGLGFLGACRVFGVNIMIGMASITPKNVPKDDSGPEPSDGLRGYYR